MSRLADDRQHELLMKWVVDGSYKVGKPFTKEQLDELALKPGTFFQGQHRLMAMQFALHGN